MTCNVSRHARRNEEDLLSDTDSSPVVSTIVPVGGTKVNLRRIEDTLTESGVDDDVTPSRGGRWVETGRVKECPHRRSL